MIRSSCTLHDPMISRFRLFACFPVLVVLVGISLVGSAQAQQETPETAPPVWGDDYIAAARMAAAEGRDLLVWFDAGAEDAAASSFANETLADVSLYDALGRYELVRIAPDTPEPGGHPPGVSPQPLLETALFHYMYDRPGLAVLEFSDEESPYYGQPVSQFPFSEEESLTAAQLAVVLDLPAGSVTQRTMIYAVRIHADQPQSTSGELSPILSRAAADHSDLQASMCRQGHHHWERRFHELNEQFDDGLVAREVCAESWQGEELVTAAVGCVHAWRHSPGHWRGVRTAHPFYGYDIELGKNDTWYATGIFVAPYGD